MPTDYAVPPGEWLVEWAKDNNISLKSLPEVLGMTEDETLRLITGDSPIMSDAAHTLGSKTGIASEWWLRMEKHYRADKARLAALSTT